jgi:hypothetical protein
VPLTFPAHQAAVLPLKRRWPQLDGVALCVGSAAPDLSYLLLGTRWRFDAHYGWAAVAWGVPITLVVTWGLRRALFTRAAAWAPARWVARLEGSAARPWHRRNLGHAVFAALIGVASHVAWDACTHDASPVADRIALLRHVALTWPTRLTVAHALQYVGHAAGSLLALAMLARWWRGPPTPGALVRPRLLIATALGGLVGALSAWLAPHEGVAAFIRGTCAAALALGVLAWRPGARAPRDPW